MHGVDHDDLRQMVREKLAEMRRTAENEGSPSVGNLEMFSAEFPADSINHHQFHYARGWVKGVAESCDCTVEDLLEELCLS
jgi:hypothetical protein